MTDTNLTTSERMPSNDDLTMMYGRKRSNLFKSKVNLPFAEMIGCGSDGTVFMTTDNRVIKITMSQPESNFLRIFSENEHKSLPIIYNIIRLCKYYTAIVREDLPDVYLDAVVNDWLNQYIDPYFDTIISDYRNRLDERLIDRVSTELTDTTMKMIRNTRKPRTRKMIRQMLSLFLWGVERGIYFRDIRLENWGMRKDGAVVLRDLGGVTMDAD